MELPVDSKLGVRFRFIRSWRYWRSVRDGIFEHLEDRRGEWEEVEEVFSGSYEGESTNEREIFKSCWRVDTSYGDHEDQIFTERYGSEP